MTTSSPHEGHDHHQPIEQDDRHASRYEVLALSIYELLLEKKVFTEQDVNGARDVLDSKHPGLGAKVIARAWTDAEFKRRLLEDASQACRELGINVGQARLVALENTPDVHNLIVCTLCSCYPRALLGWPPDWYKSANYRSRVVSEPRSVLREFGTDIDDSITVRVHDSNADLRYLVIPMQPPQTEDWSESDLAQIVTRDCMVGVRLPSAGETSRRA